MYVGRVALVAPSILAKLWYCYTTPQSDIVTECSLALYTRKLGSGRGLD